MHAKTLELAVIDFMQATGLLLRRVRSESQADELSLTEGAVIARLDRDGPATTADLARAEGMKPQSMRSTLASLEATGMIQRKPHATDGRQVMIALTRQGTALRKKTGEAKRVWLCQAVSTLNAEEREVLFKAGKIIKQLAENNR